MCNRVTFKFNDDIKIAVRLLIDSQADSGRLTRREQLRFWNDDFSATTRTAGTKQFDRFPSDILQLDHEFADWEFTRIREDDFSWFYNNLASAR